MSDAQSPSNTSLNERDVWLYCTGCDAEIKRDESYEVIDPETDGRVLCISCWSDREPS